MPTDSPDLPPVAADPLSPGPQQIAAEPEEPAGMAPVLLASLTAAAFLIFAQAFMVAPLTPRLAQVLNSSTSTIGLAVPAYLIPYGLMTLLWGPLSGRLGRRPVILASLAMFVVLTAATAMADAAGPFVLLRLLTALGASAVVPVSLVLIGDLVPFQRRGQALGWLFGGMAGGIAVGSSTGALLEPIVGWQGLFLLVAALTVPVLLALASPRLLPGRPRAQPAPSPRQIARGYAALLRLPRGRRTYAFVLLNGMLHSGVYSWMGLYLDRRFGLGPVAIGLTLLGYGVPGLLLGTRIGRIADMHGRRRLIPAGVAVAAGCALLLAAPLPLFAVAIVVLVLSLGYDMTQPPLAGIVTDLPGHRELAMGLNVFTLFVGLGVGALLFQALLTLGFTTALLVFGGVAVLAAAAAVRLFAEEGPPKPAPRGAAP